MQQPYIDKVTVTIAWNPDYPQYDACECGHLYYRHFDSYEDMEPVGCKYCMCYHFVNEDDVCEEPHT